MTILPPATDFTGATVTEGQFKTAMTDLRAFLLELLGSDGLKRPGKNRIINGNLDIWQRGTSFSTPANNAYTADRVSVSYNGTIGAFTVSQQAFTLGQTDVQGEPAFFWRWDHTVAGSGSTNRTDHRKIEGVRTFAGETCVLSLYAKADSARTVTPHLEQDFGTGGSPSGTIITAGTNMSLTTSWQKFNRTFTLPSISGKTIGTNGDDNLDVRLLFPINTTMTIDIAQVQLERGFNATPFEVLPIEQVLALCTRYFERLSGSVTSSMFGMGQAISTTLARAHIRYAEKRATPSITVSAAGDFDVTQAGGAVQAVTVLTGAAIAVKSAVMNTTVAANLVAGNATRLLDDGGTNSFIDVDSEL